MAAKSPKSVVLPSDAKVNFSMFWQGAGHRHATVNDLRGTGILDAYLATSFGYSNNRL